jgi:hypothetical protein
MNFWEILGYDHRYLRIRTAKIDGDSTVIFGFSK